MLVWRRLGRRRVRCWSWGGVLLWLAVDEGESGCGAAELAGVAGEPAGGVTGRGGQHRGGVLQRFGEHRSDLGHGDDVEVQRRAAGGVDWSGTVAADQAQEPVDGPHPGPRQRVIEQPVGVDANVLAVPGRGGPEPVEVTHRVTDPCLLY